MKLYFNPQEKKSTTPLQPYGANCIIYPPRWHERMTQQKLNNRRLFTLGTEARGSRSDANFLFLLLSPGSQSNDTILSGMNSYHQFFFLCRLILTTVGKAETSSYMESISFAAKSPFYVFQGEFSANPELVISSMKRNTNHASNNTQQVRSNGDDPTILVLQPCSMKNKGEFVVEITEVMEELQILPVAD